MKVGARGAGHEARHTFVECLVDDGADADGAEARRECVTIDNPGRHGQLQKELMTALRTRGWRSKASAAFSPASACAPLTRTAFATSLGST